MQKPTERLDVDHDDGVDTPSDPEAQLEEIRAFGRKLVDEGKAPVFEVWYPWTTSTDYDVVQVDTETGHVKTLPPYDAPFEFWSES